MTERPTPRYSTRLARSPVAAVSAALASFLVVLTLLTARVVTGTDPGLRGTAQAQVVSKGGHVIVRTTASGRVIREAVGSPSPAGAEAASVVTRSSGGGQESDG